MGALDSKSLLQVVATPCFSAWPQSARESRRLGNQFRFCSAPDPRRDIFRTELSWLSAGRSTSREIAPCSTRACGQAAQQEKRGGHESDQLECGAAPVVHGEIVIEAEPVGTVAHPREDRLGHRWEGAARPPGRRRVYARPFGRQLCALGVPVIPWFPLTRPHVSSAAPR